MEERRKGKVARVRFKAIDINYLKSSQGFDLRRMVKAKSSFLVEMATRGDIISRG